MHIVNPPQQEIAKILNAISLETCTEYGIRNINNLKPFSDPVSAGSEIKKITVLSQLLARSFDINPSGIQFVNNLIQKTYKFNFLLEDEMGVIRVSLMNCRTFLNKIINIPVIHGQGISFSMSQDLFDTERILDQYLLDNGTVRPNATPALGKINEKKEKLRSVIHKRLQKIIQTRRKVLQDDYYTIRDGRYVLPVRSGFKNSIPGVIRDTSQSGDTFFIEADVITNINDELYLTLKDEEREKTAVLIKLTAYLRERSVGIIQTLEDVGYFDSLLSRAKFMLKNDLYFPECSQGSMFLRSAVHPCLAGRENMIPNDFMLDEGERLFLITGPNGGGKTVALTTIATIILLTQMAVPVPARDGSRIRFFDSIYFDIGDTQDIETGVSSFTSKMSLWKKILEGADQNSLIVVDELGNFTNPQEGAALSCAFISTLIEKNATILAGTHLDQVKEYVLTIKDARVASMAWDDLSDKPAYKIIYNIASGSHAIDVVRKMGFPDSFLKKCEALIKDEYVQLDEIKNKYVESSKKLLRETEKVEKEREELQQMHEEQKRELTAIKKEKYLLKENFQNIIDNINKKYISKLKEIPLDQKAFKNVFAEIQLDAETADEFLFKDLTYRNNRTIKEGDIVFIPRFKKEAKIISVDNDIVQVAVGNVTLTLRQHDIWETAGDVSKSKTQMDKTRSTVSKELAGELFLDVRGMRVEEALPYIDKMIDNALIQGARTIKIFHGAGQGKLWEAIHDFLKGHLSVKSFSKGDNLSRGGSYFTVVEIK